MIRQNQRLLNYVQKLVDVAIIIVSLLASYAVYCLFFQDYRINHHPAEIILAFVFVIGIHFVFFNIFNIYTSRRASSFLLEFIDIVKSTLFSYIFIAAAAYFFNILSDIQFILLTFFILNTTLITLYRFILRKFLRFARSKGYNRKFLVLLGINACTKSFTQKIATDLHLGYHIIGAFHMNAQEATNLNIPYLGSPDDFESFIENNIVDEVIIMFDNDETEKIKKGVAICEKWGVKFTIVPSIFSILPNRIYINNFDGLPVLNIRNIPLENIFYKTIKRICDIIISLFCLILFSPLMLITDILIKCTSKGPVIFKQIRVGENRKNFQMYKFRSMKTETENIIKMTQENDDRCTKIGRFIRKYSIDELPQLFNVLIGDMSLVGPRPEIPHFVDEFREEIPQYMIKHYVKPGMTGWAQVNGLRGNTSIEERIRYDIYYIEHWSLWFDIKILALTVIKGIFNQNAY